MGQTSKNKAPCTAWSGEECDMANKKVESVIHADGVDIAVVTTVGKEEDYISLTDMARHKNPIAPKDVVKNWLRLRSTIDFLGLWEELNNPNF